MTKPNIETRSYAITQIETRAADVSGGDKTVSGYIAVFGSPSYDLGGFTEEIAPGAFTRSLEEVEAGEKNVAALFEHSWANHLGSTRSGKLKLTQDDTGLAFTLNAKRVTPAMLDQLADRDLQCSFGFSVRRDSWVEREDGTVHRTILDVELYEVTLTANPAYQSTTAALRSMDAWRAAMATIDTREILEEIAAGPEIAEIEAREIREAKFASLREELLRRHKENFLRDASYRSRVLSPPTL